jgi:tripartite ATP-independent transporter DctP family solute receptor
MKKILSLLLATSLVFALTACGDTTADSSTDTNTDEVSNETVEPVVFRLAETHPGDYPTTLGDMEFARLVEEKTEGRVKIEVYHSKQLGEEKDVIEQVQFGAIDFTRVSIGPLAEFSPQLNVLALPYIYNGADHMWTVLNSEVGQDMLDSVYDHGFIGLGYYDGGARSFYNSVRPIEKLEDLAGLKFRVMQNEMMVDMVEALGANPTPMAYGEVYSSIQTGVIDGAENNWPSYDTSSHYEVAQYYTLDEHLRVPEILIASTAIMDKISEEDLALIKEAAKESQDFQREKWEEKSKASEEKIVAAGNQVTYLSDEAKKEFSDAMTPVYEKYASEYSDIIEKIQGMK